jgi:hypothetical protein
LNKNKTDFSGKTVSITQHEEHAAVPDYDRKRTSNVFSRLDMDYILNALSTI